MRIFAALVPPAEAVDDLDEFLTPRREADPGPRWVLPEQLHLTLAFAADAIWRDVDEASDYIGQSCARRPPLDLVIAGAGAFPGPGHARVLWMGVEADGRGGNTLFGDPARLAGADPVGSGVADELTSLAQGVRTAARNAGVNVEGGAFRPHITVARLGRPADATKWLRVLDTYQGPTWRAEEVTLFASHLGQGRGGRPRYEELGAFPLRGEPREGAQ